MTRNIFCMKWGAAYTAQDVNILYAMVKRNLGPDLRFICLTDDTTGIRPDVECRVLPDVRIPPITKQPGWKKLIGPKAVSDLDGDVLFLDLDLVIRDRLEAFFEHEPGRFCIIHDWSHPERNEGNSSVYRFPAGSLTDLAERFEQDAEHIIRNYANEQVWLTEQVPATLGEVVFWPDTWCRSFKRHCLGGRFTAPFRVAREPRDTRIVVFHGHPKPDEAIAGEWKGRFKWMRPTPWIASYWHE